MRRTLATALIAVPVAAAAWPAGAGILPLALVGVPWGLAAHRRAGSALEGRVLALSAGVLARRLELVPVARLQSARTSANPLQRRAGLASLHLDVAGNRLPLLIGGPGLADLEAAVAATARARVTVP
jgi:membrane protein YdbS with pleckstrin-like domain